MRQVARTITTCLAVLAAVALFSVPRAYAAKASFDQPPGEPPYGLAVQGERGGTKLYGVIELEYYVLNETTADVQAVVRLRKGNQLKVFYSGVIREVNFIDPKIVQVAVTNAVESQILEGFFPGENGLCVWFKSASEYAKLDFYDPLFFEVMDFEIAVSSCQ